MDCSLDTSTPNPGTFTFPVNVPINFPIAFSPFISGLLPPFEIWVKPAELPPGLTFNSIGPVAIDPLWNNLYVPTIADAPQVTTNIKFQSTIIIGTPTTPGTYTFNIFPNGTDLEPPAPIGCFLAFTFIITAPAPKKRKRKGAPIICCDPKQFPNGCPDQLRTASGNEYQKISDYCYMLIRKRK